MLTLPNYQVTEQIYESANSTIYCGQRKSDNKPVILKILKQDYPTSAELNRYQQEYEITHSLNSKGIIKTYDIEKYQNTLVIILEDFGGNSLKKLMLERPFNLLEFLPIAIQTAESLADIHIANIIHKDINPSNIIWESVSKQVKIIDFGIANRLPRENPILKNPEQLEGTLAYLSPEQTGRINRSIDYRTDLYSLGITFYEMLCGRLPFDSKDTMELIHCHIAKNPIPVDEINPKIPPIISAIIMKLLAKNAEDRYQSASGVKADLEKVLNLQDLEGLPFELAEHDFSGHFRIPQKLYGREDEIDTLLQAFTRVSSGTAEMILIAGYSGVGKTAIVNEVHKPMTEKRGYFATGKFDQYQRNVPYSALTQAFNEFCNYLLTESTEQLKDWQEKILNAVGNNGQVLIEVIPNLELIIGKQEAAIEVGIAETKNRFNLVFENFFHIIGQQNHPLILFIDDLQWADSASLSLLKKIMADINDKYFLIIGAYRDNEVDSTHPLMDLPANTIQVQNLSFADVNTLIAESIGSTDVEQLADLVYSRTQGNAFFTHEFLKSLYEEELLTFNVTQWQWDIAKISAKDMTDNVVELMVSKIEKLPPDVIGILKLAACIGNQFDLETLSIIYQHSCSDTFSCLWKAIEENLVLTLNNDYKQPTACFKFQHDRIQQAAYSLIGDLQKSQLHLQIGRLLLNNSEQIFTIVDHLNIGVQLIDSQLEKDKIARLNLQAGKKALAATAYEAATNYLQVGLDLLTKDSWQTRYELTLKLYVKGAETAYLNGDFKLMDKLVQTVLDHAQNLLDKVSIYQVKISAYQAQNQLLNGFNTGLEILKLLGVSFPKSPNQSDFMSALQETQTILTDKPIKELIDLPYMTNQQQLAVIQILSSIFSASYQAAPTFMPLLVFKQVTLSVRYGNTSESAFAYANYGLILCALVSDIENGYQFGQLALKLLDKFEAKELKARTYVVMNNLIRHWKEHVEESLPPLLEGYQTGLDTGDLEWAAWCIVVHYYHAYLIGRKLPTLDREMARYNEIITKMKQKTPLHWQQMYRQAVLNLLGYASDSPTKLIGESYNELEMLPQHLEANDRTMLSHFYLNKIILCYLFGEYIAAVEYANMAENYLDGAVGLLVTPYFYFYDSLSILACNSINADILEKISINQDKIAYWAKYAPENYQHKHDLIEAEKNRVLGQILAAEELYEQAIAGAKENKYLQEEALSYELAAKFYFQRGMEKIFQTYIKEAYYRYQQWGAVAKTTDLETKYPQLLTTSKTFNQDITATISTLMNSVSTKLQTSTVLDLGSITKASQTLAGEIVLSKLLERIMSIMIENAGAERGLLILEKNESEWVIEAEGKLDINEITILQSIPLDGNLPISMANYVLRTHESVVLNNAQQEGVYTGDDYIQQQQVKSVLCSPILHQGQLIGLLYLENSLIEGAFTSARLKIVDMLSSQAAISLENSLLYQTLENKVEQRTTQLATANQKITLLNERLKEENVRMGTELDVAKQLQQMVLPKENELLQIEKLDIAGFMEPAEEVGGDYYEVLNHDGHIKIGIGDVTGHGLESGVLMLMVQTTVRALLLAGIDNPEIFLNVVNRTVYHNAKRMGTDKNLTLSLLDYQAGKLTITGQHEEVLLIRKGGKVERIDTFDLGFMVGVEKDMTKFISHQDVLLQSGDGIVLYTDGITEAQNVKEKQYGLERLCEVVSNSWSGDAKQVQQAVVTDVKDYIGKRKVLDDITLLVLKQK